MGMWASIGAAIGAVAGIVISIYAPELGVPLTTACVGALTAAGTAAGSAGDAKVEKDAAEAKKEGDDRAAELQASRDRLKQNASSFGASSVVSGGVESSDEGSGEPHGGRAAA